MAGENIVAASLGVRLWMDVKSFFSGSNRAQSELGKLRRAFSLGGLMDFGKRGALGQLAELAKGGGIIAGVTLLSRELEKASDQLDELRVAFNAGQISVSQYAGEVSRALPILGDFIHLFDEVREAITGERSALRQAEEQAKVIEEATNYRIAQRKQEADAAKKQQEAAAAERKVIDELIGAIEKEARELNMTRREVEEYALAQHDATDADRERLRAAFDLIDAYEQQKNAEKELADLQEQLVARRKKIQADEMKAIEDRADEIARIEEQSMTEAERAQAEIDRLQGFLESGDIQEETFRRRLEQIARQFRQPRDRADELLSGPQFGSRSAAQAALRGLGQRRDVADVERDQLQQQKEAKEILRRIERLLESGGVELVGVDP